MGAGLAVDALVWFEDDDGEIRLGRVQRWYSHGGRRHYEIWANDEPYRWMAEDEIRAVAYDPVDTYRELNAAAEHAEARAVEMGFELEGGF